MVDGIEIDKKDAEDSLLPEDLNSLAVGSYVVPNPSRRKYYPAYILSVCALFLIASFFLTFINFLPTLIILVLLAALLLFLNNKFKIKAINILLCGNAYMENISSIDMKNKIAKVLSEIGVDYIEGGWPGANPIDTTFFSTPP